MASSKMFSETLHYILCPHCEKGKSRICHLFNQGPKGWGPWFCDKCGGGYHGTVDGERVTVEKSKNRKDDTIVFLKRDNLLLAVKGMMWGGELSENSRFYYEESTCPTNYFNSSLECWDLETGEIDPHGVFEFVGEVPAMTEEELADIDPNEFTTKLRLGMTMEDRGGD